MYKRQYLDSDPPNPIEGQMWFNSTTQTLKGAEAGGIPVGTWASGGNFNTGRSDLGATGDSSDALIFAGYTGPAYVANTESYNGTTWTEVNDLNQGRATGGAAGASSTSALMISGASPPGAYKSNVETWDGTNWTEVAELSSVRNNGAV